MRKARCFEFTYSVLVPKLASSIHGVAVWAPFPRNTPHQEVHDLSIRSSLPYEIKYDPVYGNAVLHATGSKTPAPLELTICARASRYERRIRFDQKGAAAHTMDTPSPFRAQLTENRLIRFSAEILQIAAKIKATAKHPVEIARGAYEHVLTNMKYDKTLQGWGEGDSQFACSIGGGNCTDFHSLFLAIIRACGVPGQFEIGMAFPVGMTEGDITAYKCGYHCWASFFAPSVGWIPVDCSEAAQKPELREYYFGSLDENRFLLSYGRDIELPGRSRRQLVNFFTEPVIETEDGTSVGYEKTLTFRNL